MAAFVPYVPQSVVLESQYTTIDLSFLFRLSAIFWRHAGRFGSLAVTGYLVATSGIASIVGPDPRMFGLEFYLVGSIVAELGLLALAIAMIRQDVIVGTAWCWIVSVAGSILVPFRGADLA